MAHVHGLRHNDGVLMPAPLAHISGLLNGVLLPGVVPMKAVLMDRWDADHAVSLVAEERVSFMIGPPTFFVGMMAAASFTPRKVGSLRLVSSGGATVTPAFVASATQALGCRVKRTYGSTEAPTVTTSPSRTSVERSRLTDGKPVGEVELRISDASTGAAVPAGSVGEVWVRGPELFVGYADEAQTRAAHARGGWFRTGDLGSVDGDGWLTISGRLKDVIIRGGENVVAAEVEATVNAHPAVRDAVVVGYPDAVFGERVAAVVVASKPFDVDVCRTWCASRGMTKFKIPERVIQVDELPMMAAGKADRAAIARLAREWRGA
jgi:acyl-CoA synthetase (AMP-forming)/AMP-acid ligase II